MRRFLYLILTAFWALTLPAYASPQGDESESRSQIEVTLFEGGEGLDFYSRAAQEFQDQTRRNSRPSASESHPALRETRIQGLLRDFEEDKEEKEEIE